MMVEDIKKDVNDLLKEIQENTAKQVEDIKEETQKSLKELQGNTTKQVMELNKTIQEVKSEVDTIKKTQSEAKLEIETLGKKSGTIDVRNPRKEIWNHRWEHQQQNTRDGRENLRCKRFHREHRHNNLRKYKMQNTNTLTTERSNKDRELQINFPYEYRCKNTQ